MIAAFRDVLDVAGWRKRVDVIACVPELNICARHLHLTTMASNGPPSDLSKLTVPQLKALCKERRITGYSKLGKAALLQRLTEATAPAKTTTPSNDQAGQRTTAAPSIIPTAEVRNPSKSSVESSTASHATNVVHQPVQALTGSNTKSTETSTTKAPLSTERPLSSQNRTAASTTNTQKPYGTKRPAHIDISAPPKWIRTSITPATNAAHDPPVPRTSTKLPADSSAFKIPELPAQRKRSFQPEGSASRLAKQVSGTSRPSAVLRQVPGGPGRFKLLVVSRPDPVEPDEVHKGPSRAPVVSVIPRAVDSAPVSNFRTKPLPVLGHISFPPKASERKSVYRWAIILSALSSTERQTCMLVSRTFRYAGRNILPN